MPFAIAASVWGIFGCAVAIFSGAPVISSLGWMGGLWLLSLVDLVALAQAISAVVALGSDVRPEHKPALYTQAMTWGAIKLACLGGFAIVLIAGKGAPAAALLLGLGTMIVVPLAGGFFWSREVLNHA